MEVFMDFSKIDAAIAANMEHMLKDLETLVSHDSEYSTPEPGAPFGRAAAECLCSTEKLISACGFHVQNHENYVLSVDYDPDLPPALDILAHLDVVPAGNGWTVTDPFTMKRIGDRVYGRGTSDDKGPALCALYAMRALRQCGVQLKSNVRLILGSDEECGSRDLEHYFKTHKSAPYSVSPDADFPCINLEKGGLHSGFSAVLPVSDHLPRVLSIHSGTKINVVPDLAEAVFEGIDPCAARKIADGLGCGGCSVELTSKNDLLYVRVTGKNAHASAPQEGKNALTALLKFLSMLELSSSPLHSALDQIARLFPHGDHNGAALGVDLSDEVSGKTTLTLDILNYDPEHGLEGRFDCRACLSANEENTQKVIYDHLRSAGLTPENSTMYGPHYVPEDSFLVQTLMSVCFEMSGKHEKPIVTGGGTYVHAIENGVAFGICDPAIDTHMHGADEFIPISQLVYGTRVYARTIVRLCGVR